MADTRDKAESGDGREVLSVRELKEKWLKLMVDMLGWGEEEDIWSYMGRIRGGWAEQFQVLRSAPLMMMMMDTEEHLTQVSTKWKMRWREAITGDENMRIRDHMDNREVQKRVKLVDTASFTLGIVMIMLSEFLLVGYPGGFPWFYLITNILLMLLRYLTYKAIKNHFFMLDFCYFLNVSVLLQSLTCSAATEGFCSAWFKSNFMLSHGPIAVAILAWQNSLVFHSLDKMTSFYIHIMPPLTCYLLRWDVISGSAPPEGFSLSFSEAFIIPMFLYSVWQVFYLYIQYTVIDRDPELVTSLRYLTQCPRNPMYIITMDVCIRLGVLKKDEKYSSDDTKTKVIYVIGQWVYMLLMLIPVPLLFYFRFFNTSFLFILILAGIWRGGSYYIFKFSRSYNQKFEVKKRDE